MGHVTIGCVEDMGLDVGVWDGLSLGVDNELGQETNCCPTYETLNVYPVPHVLTTRFELS